MNSHNKSQDMVFSQFGTFCQSEIVVRCHNSASQRLLLLLLRAFLLLSLASKIFGLQPPVAYSGSLTVTEDFGGYRTYTLRASDTDTGETLRYFITKIPEKLELYQYDGRQRIFDSSRDESLVKDPGGRVLIIASYTKNLNGMDNFTFIAEDSRYLQSNAAQVSITITAVPDPPQIPASYQKACSEDTPSWISLCYIICYDIDRPAVRLNFTLRSLPDNGLFYDVVGNNLVHITNVPYDVQSPNSTLLFVPSPDYNISSEFNIDASTGLLSASAKINLMIFAVNDPPVAENVNIITPEDTPTTIILNCSDADSGYLTYRLLSFPVRHRFLQFSNKENDTFGSDIISYVTNPNGMLWVVPGKDFFGTILVMYECIDSGDARSNKANVTITVNPVNDAPTGTNSKTIVFPFNFMSGSFDFISIPIFAEDVDDDVLFVMIIDPPEHGFLADVNGTELKSGDKTSIDGLRFYSNSSGGGYPYGNFSFVVADPQGATTEKCLITFETPCAPLYMNIYSNGTGSVCETCPLGANCSVIGDRAPIAANGYWKVPGRDDLYLTCDPPSSCPGSAIEICAEGYQGIRCGGCEYGYYRGNKHCLKCNSQAIFPGVAYMLAIIVVLRVVSLYMQNPSISVFYITLGFIQALTVVGEIDIDWPTLFKNILQLLAVSNMKEEYIMPECLFGGILHDWYYHKMWIAWLLPMLLCATSILVIVLEVLWLKLWNWWRLRYSLKNGIAISPQTVHLPPLVSYIRVFHVVLYISYLNFIKSSVNVFDCTVGLDGNAYLDADPSFRCYTEEWQKRVPLAIAGLCLFVIGIPLYFTSLLYFKYHPKVDKTVKSWSTELLTFGHSYKQEAYCFVVIQLIMKAMLVCSNIFLSGRPALQVVSAYVIFEIDFFLHVYLRPYVPNELNIFHAVSNCCAMLVLLLGLFHDQTSSADWMSSESKGFAVGLLLVMIVAVYILAVASWLVYSYVARKFKLMDKLVVKPQPLRGSQSISSP